MRHCGGSEEDLKDLYMREGFEDALYRSLRHFCRYIMGGVVELHGRV